MWLLQSVGELGLAAPKEVATVNEDSPVIEALKLIDQSKVSGLPVIDNKGGFTLIINWYRCIVSLSILFPGHVVDVFTKTDVLVLAGEQLFYDLSIKVGTVISLHSVEQTEDASPSLNRWARMDVRIPHGLPIGIFI